MNIFFDVDYTLISWDGSLRPGVRETFEQLNEDGHRIYIWSGVGIRWDVIDRHGLRDLIVSCHVKPLWNHHDQLPRLGVPVVPDFCIDDHQEIIDAFGGYRIRPYNHPDKADQEMRRVVQLIAAAVVTRRAPLE